MTKEEFKNIQSRLASWMDFAISFQFAVDAIKLLETAKMHYEGQSLATACASFSTQIITNYAHPFTEQKNLHGRKQHNFPIKKIRHHAEFNRDIHEDFLKLRHGIVGHSDHNFHQPDISVTSVSANGNEAVFMGLAVRIKRLEVFEHPSGYEKITSHISCLQKYCLRKAQDLVTECDAKLDGDRPDWLVNVIKSNSDIDIPVGTNEKLSIGIEDFVSSDLKKQRLPDLDLRALKIRYSQLSEVIPTKNPKHIRI